MASVKKMFTSSVEFASELAKGGIRSFNYENEYGQFSVHMTWTTAEPLLAAIARYAPSRFTDGQGITVWACFPEDKPNGEWWFEYPAGAPLKL